MSSFVRLVCHTSELQEYTARRLYSALRADVSQESLTLASVWILGEFADGLLQNNLQDELGKVRHRRCLTSHSAG